MPKNHYANRQHHAIKTAYTMQAFVKITYVLTVNNATQVSPSTTSTVRPLQMPQAATKAP